MDHIESGLGIEDELQIDLDPYPIPTLNPSSKWDQNSIEVVRNMVGDSSD